MLNYVCVFVFVCMFVGPYDEIYSRFAKLSPKHLRP